MRLAVVALAMLSGLAACSAEDATAIDAVVSEGEPPLGLRLDLVRVVVGPADDPDADARAVERSPAYDGDRLRPLTVRLVPDAGRPAGTVYRVRAEGISQDRVVVRVQHRVTFIAGRTIALPLRFEGTCVEVSCARDQTCQTGRCVDDSQIDCELGGAAARCDAGGVRSDASPTDATPTIDTGPIDIDPSDTGTDDATPADAGSMDAGPIDAGPTDSGPGDVGRDAADCCPDDGLSCTTDTCTGRGCAHTVDPGFCLIEGACVPNGRRDPTNDCRQCSSATRPTDWTHLTDGSCNDGLFCTTGDTCNDDGVCTGSAGSCGDARSCTTDTCDEGTDECLNVISADRCLIDSDCYASGADNPENQCQECRPSVAQTEWSDSSGSCSDGLGCTGPDHCVAGTCVSPSLCEPSEVCEASGCRCAAGRIDCDGFPDNGCECMGELCATALCP